MTNIINFCKYMSLLGLDVASYEDMEYLNKKYGINLFQIAAKYINKDILTNTDKSILKRKYSTVVHYSYSINLAHTWNKNDWWIQQLIGEIKSAHLVGAFGIVIHTGKSLNYSKSTAINNMFSSLLYVHEQTAELLNIKILIETPAGQGTELLKDLDNFIRFMLKFENTSIESIKNRFGICIDTCHIYAAGYDISDEDVITSYFNTIHKKIGLDKIKLIHLNNSRGVAGSKIDRHANLHTGEINIDSIKMIIRFINKLEIPMILETPMGDDYEFILKDYKFLAKQCKLNKLN